MASVSHLNDGLPMGHVGQVCVYAVSLGCPKNRIDTELALGGLGLKRSFTLVEEAADADVLLINTCSFIEEAVSESLEVILSLGQEKRQDQFLIVMGCLVQRYGNTLVSELPEVDMFLGADTPHELGNLLCQTRPPVLSVARTRRLVPETVPRFLTTPPWRAYVRLAEGCSNRCTYCLIPEIRGPLRNRKADAIVSEVESLVAKGAKEITLVAQDLTAYQDNGSRLPGLLERVVEETDIPWIRLLYLHPARVDDALLEVMATHTRICPYLDIPIQHASSQILRAMGRPYDRQDIQGLVRRVRTILPQAALRTTVIVGFPGESEEDFGLLLESISEWQFDHLGCFAYSDEEGCHASHLQGKVDSDVAKERREQVMALQAEITKAHNAAMVGRIEPVLIEGYSAESKLLLEGRTVFQAPEIDGVVYVTTGSASAGGIVPIRITEAHTYDLVGEIAEA